MQIIGTILPSLAFQFKIVATLEEFNEIKHSILRNNQSNLGAIALVFERSNYLASKQILVDICSQLKSKGFNINERNFSVTSESALTKDKQYFGLLKKKYWECTIEPPSLFAKELNNWLLELNNSKIPEVSDLQILLENKKDLFNEVDASLAEDDDILYFSLFDKNKELIKDFYYDYKKNISINSDDELIIYSAFKFDNNVFTCAEEAYYDKQTAYELYVASVKKKSELVDQVIAGIIGKHDQIASAQLKELFLYKHSVNIDSVVQISLKFVSNILECEANMLRDKLLRESKLDSFIYSHINERIYNILEKS